MSMDPAMMQQMLMQGLQGGSAGGGMAGPQMQGQVQPVNAAADLVRKAMLVHSLTQPAMQQRQANAMIPGTQAAGANAVGQNPQIQAMQQQMQQPMPMPPIDPSLMPTPGLS